MHHVLRLGKHEHEKSLDRVLRMAPVVMYRASCLEHYRLHWISKLQGQIWSQDGWTRCGRQVLSMVCLGKAPSLPYGRTAP
jgi:hypothetical protein